MGIKLGNDYLLWIKPASGQTFLVVMGQGDLSIKRSAASIDTGSKTSGGFATKAGGLRDGSATLKLNPELPDPGYTALETDGKSSPPANFTVQVRKGGIDAEDADAIFECLVFCSDFNDDFGKNNVVSVDTTLAFAAAPTIDTLA